MADTKYTKKIFSEIIDDVNDLDARDTTGSRNSLYNGIVKSLYIDGKSREELADEFGISLADVKRLENTALRAFYAGSVKKESKGFKDLTFSGKKGILVA